MKPLSLPGFAMPRSWLMAFAALATTLLCGRPAAAHPPPDELTDRACGAALKVGSVPGALADAVARFNVADRKGGPTAFDDAHRALAAVPGADPVIAAYASLLRAFARARYLKGQADLDAAYATLGQLAQADLCRLRALLEDDVHGARLKGVFAYDPAVVTHLARTDPGKVGEIFDVFSRAGDIFHRIGARQHFFVVTYDFADVFEPIRDQLPEPLARRLSATKIAFGKQHARLFSDLPSLDRHTSE